ncbi:hypothetical protein MHYP_G00242620 [Metynnis hypsauchen]
MGSSVSAPNQSGNIGSGSSGITIGSITFSGQSGTQTTVANATGKKLRIFYHKEEIKLEDVLTTDSVTTQKIFKPKEEINFIELPPNQHIEVPCLDEGFISIFVADIQDSEVYIETVSLNFKIPYGACGIVTANNEIKFRKYGGGIWIDEDGQDHSPK